MLGGQLDDAPPALRRQRPPARVLEGRDRVEEARRAGAQLALQAVRIEAVVVHRQGHDIRAEPREELQRPVVARRLDEHAAGPALEQLLEVEEDALEPSARHDHARRLDAVPLRQPLAERAIPAAGAVREHGRVALDGGTSAVGEQLDGEALRCGCSSCERDHRPRLLLPCCHGRHFGRPVRLSFFGSFPASAGGRGSWISTTETEESNRNAVLPRAWRVRARSAGARRA